MLKIHNEEFTLIYCVAIGGDVIEQINVVSVHLPDTT